MTLLIKLLLLYWVAEISYFYKDTRLNAYKTHQLEKFLVNSNY